VSNPPPLLSKERAGVRFIIKIINLSPTLPFVRGEGASFPLSFRRRGRG